MVNDVFFHKPITFIRKSELVYDFHRYSKLIVETVSNKNVYYITDSLGSITNINLSDVTHCESQRNYINIYNKNDNKPLSIRKTLKSLLEEIDSTKVLQIHKSFVIVMENIHQLKVDKVILINGTELIVSKNYREQVRQKFLEYMR
jgi:DNA-binding LytR/AlgR family response regulator